MKTSSKNLIGKTVETGGRRIGKVINMVKFDDGYYAQLEGETKDDIGADAHENSLTIIEKQKTAKNIVSNNNLPEFNYDYWAWNNGRWYQSFYGKTKSIEIHCFSTKSAIKEAGELFVDGKLIITGKQLGLKEDATNAENAKVLLKYAIDNCGAINDKPIISDNVINCPRCKTKHFSHIGCPNCGYTSPNFYTNQRKEEPQVDFDMLSMFISDINKYDIPDYHRTNLKLFVELLSKKSGFAHKAHKELQNY